MKSNIFIPEKINVGYRERNDTYTKRLAYVIYFDEKGNLRKETSWNSWRDEKLGNDIYENIPTSGFVLNKKAGGYSTGWNHRQTYVRVYDPRGFEFEITVPNLMYILENATSTKGKGLEGEFVYGFDGKDLVLIPTESPDYIEIMNFNKAVHSDFKLKGKDLKLGATYLTKGNEELVYLGRFDKWETSYNRETHRYDIDVNKGKHYFFKRNANYGDGIEAIKSLNKFIALISDECVENYAELMEKLERNKYYSPIDNSKDEYVPFTFEEFENAFTKDSWGVNFYTPNGDKVEIRRENYGNSTENLKIEQKVEYQRQGYWGKTITDYRYEYVDVGSIKDVFNKNQPHYLRKYLANGKIYSEGKTIW